MGPKYLFLQSLKIASSNFLYNLGLGSSLSEKLFLGKLSLPRNNFSDKKLTGVWAREH